MTGPGVNSALFPSQDSNMSTGSSHSNDGNSRPGCQPPLSGMSVMDKSIVDPSPEKMSHPIPTARTPTERKRKRKNQESGGVGSSPAGQLADRGVGGGVGLPPGSVADGGKGTKKINDYFKHTPSSPVRQPNPNSAPGTPTPQPFPSSLYHHQVSTGSLSPVAPSIPPVAVVTGDYVPLLSARGSGSGSGIIKAVKFVQTDSTMKDFRDLEEEVEKKDNRIEELTSMNDELTRQVQAKQKEIDEKSSTIVKCLSVVKELLTEKTTIDKKNARQACMQNRLRLGQFVTQRVGATFQENWTDGFAFQELAKRQEEINNEREEIEKKKKLLVKRKPSEVGGANRKRSNTANSTSGGKELGTGNSASVSVGLHNGTSSADETMFTKPPPRDGMTMQEYYECEEVLK